MSTQSHNQFHWGVTWILFLKQKLLLIQKPWCLSKASHWYPQPHRPFSPGCQSYKDALVSWLPTRLTHSPASTGPSRLIFNRKDMASSLHGVRKRLLPQEWGPAQPACVQPACRLSSSRSKTDHLQQHAGQSIPLPTPTPTHRPGCQQVFPLLLKEGGYAVLLGSSTCPLSGEDCSY